jgi:hypothetical protein
MADKNKFYLLTQNEKALWIAVTANKGAPAADLAVELFRRRIHPASDEDFSESNVPGMITALDELNEVIKK